MFGGGETPGNKGVQAVVATGATVLSGDADRIMGGGIGVEGGVGEQGRYRDKLLGGRIL